MSRLPKLLAAGALLAGSGTITVLANPALGGDPGPPPAVITATAAFECTDEAVTVTWTITVESEEGQSTEIVGAEASPGEVEVDFTPSDGLEDGDTATGTSTHAPDTTDVTLTLGHDTFTEPTEQNPVVFGGTQVVLPVECPAEPPPPPVEEPPAAEPTVAQPTVTG